MEKRQSTVRLSAARKTAANYLTEPVVRFLATTPISPNALTWFGFFLTVGAAILITTGHLLAAGFLVLIGSFFDILDGALARRINRTTRFGAVLDSTLDRLSEAVLFLGILGLFLLTAAQPVLATVLSKEWAILLVFVTLFGSALVSYIRARAEAIGIECQVGLFTRSERIVVLVLGLWLNQIVIALAIIAVLSLVTAGQRLIHIEQRAKN
ncbi:CDP-alcohol phosphatidyltransferase family protein [Chloroflexota bacterium]